MDSDREHDARVRGAAFEWLARQVSIHGDVLPRQNLARGFELEGQRVPVLGPQGIFKPALMQVPLSITTSPRRPYDDAIGSDNLLSYRYRGSDPGHRDNVGLRFAMQNRLPLAYFHGVIPGRYLAMWPVYVVGDAPQALNQYQGGMCISGSLTMTERTPRHLISPLGPNCVGTDSAV